MRSRFCLLRTPLVALMLFTLSISSAPPSSAQMDSHLVGKWNAFAGPGTVFEVDPDGRYRTTVNGKVVESGQMTAADGTWSLKSDGGRVDHGKFTTDGGGLQLQGESVTTAWLRSGHNKLAPSSHDSAATMPKEFHTLNGVPIQMPDGKTAFERSAAVRRALRNSNGGWLANPPGGYVPVRSDGAARNYWRSH
jgi:hypothetical protein